MKRLRPELGPFKRRPVKAKSSARGGMDWVTTLAALRETRASYAGCARKLVDATLREHVADDGTLVEIGAGTGQLREWLSAEFRARFVHTDVDARALSRMTSDFPDAVVQRSGVESLPFGDAEVTAVVGLCVLDLAADLTGALNEIRRVLRRDGRLIHLLDMQPALDHELAELAREGKLALPNLFGEPLDSSWPRDLLVTEKAPMAALLRALRQANHPLPEVFGRFFAVAMGEPFDAKRASQELGVVSRTPEMRGLMRTMLESAYKIGWQLRLEPPRGVLISSGKHFAERIERSAVEAGLEVVASEVRTTWVHQPASEEAVRCRSLALGQGRLVDHGEPLLCREAPLPPDGEELSELGMMVFVARAPSIRY